MSTTLPDYALPFGLRQVVITPYLPTGALDTANAVALPAARTFSFSETEDFETLDGNDRTVASHGAGPTVDWELEGGGISLKLWKTLSGGITTASGTSGSLSNKYVKKISDSRPYFHVAGRAISDNGGDFHAEVHRCKADGDLKGEMANGSFYLTNATGKGYGDEVSEELYEFTHNEKSTPIAI